MFFIFMLAGIVAALFLTRRLAGRPNERQVTTTLSAVLGVVLVITLFGMLGLALWLPNATAVSLVAEALAGLTMGALLIYGNVLKEFVSFSEVVEEEEQEGEEDDDDHESDETQEEIAGLEEEIGILEGEIEEFEGEREGYETSIEEHQAAIDEAKSEIEDINSAIAERNQQISELRAKIKGLEDGTGESENAGTNVDAAQPASSTDVATGAPTTDAAQVESASPPATSDGGAQSEPAAPVADSATPQLSLTKEEPVRDGASGTTGSAGQPGPATGGGENKQ